MYKSLRSGSNWTPSLMSKPPLLWGISTELLSTRCHRFVLILWSQSNRGVLYHRPARHSILLGRFSMQQHSCSMRIYAPWHVFLRRSSSGISYKLFHLSHHFKDLLELADRMLICFTQQCMPFRTIPPDHQFFVRDVAPRRQCTVGLGIDMTLKLFKTCTLLTRHCTLRISRFLLLFSVSFSSLSISKLTCLICNATFTPRHADPSSYS